MNAIQAPKGPIERPSMPRRIINKIRAIKTNHPKIAKALHVAAWSAAFFIVPQVSADVRAVVGEHGLPTAFLAGYGMTEYWPTVSTVSNFIARGRAARLKTTFISLTFIGFYYQTVYWPIIVGGLGLAIKAGQAIAARAQKGAEE